MKKIFKSTLIFAATCAMTMGMASCSDDDDNNGGGSTTVSENETMMKAIADQFVDATVKDTYKGLADDAEKLATAVSEMRESAKTHAVTQAQVDNACTLFRSARANYEKSEAFLLGAAAKYKVDPHIDSWPLDVNAVVTTVTNTALLARLDSDDGNVVANSELGNSNLGFHALEFILFRAGQNRSIAELNGNDSYADLTAITGEQELIYAKAVAGDLRDNCYIMEIGWNEDSNDAHKAWLEGLEYDWTTTGNISFGEDFKTAGVAGSSYRTLKSALAAILIGDTGARGICDEVGDTKIGKPHNGTSEEDINYIESPYSYNSITDFCDNIISIEDVWFGGMEGNRKDDASFHGYFAKYHPAEGTAVETAITNAKAAINAMPFPFVLNRTASECQTAIDACHVLSTALDAANTAMQND